MDALDLLMSSHQRVRGMCHQFEQALDDGNGAAMLTLAGRMRAEIETHMVIEDELFYPAVRDLGEDVAVLVAEGIEEHHDVKLLLSELVDLSPGASAWKARWTVLMERIEHHTDHEEAELFSRVRTCTTSDWRRKLGERLAVRKGRLGADLTRRALHPVAAAGRRRGHGSRMGATTVSA